MTNLTAYLIPLFILCERIEMRGRHIKNRIKVNKIAKLDDVGLPPRLPQTIEELDLTIRILGNRKQCELGAKPRRRLEKLIGIYPSVAQAGLWKQILRRVCRHILENADLSNDTT